MSLEPYAISKQPQGYSLTLSGEPLSTHRRKRDALSHAVAAIHARALLR